MKNPVLNPEHSDVAVRVLVNITSGFVSADRYTCVQGTECDFVLDLLTTWFSFSNTVCFTVWRPCNTSSHLNFHIYCRSYSLIEQRISHVLVFLQPQMTCHTSQQNALRNFNSSISSRHFQTGYFLTNRSSSICRPVVIAQDLRWFLMFSVVWPRLEEHTAPAVSTTTTRKPKIFTPSEVSIHLKYAVPTFGLVSSSFGFRTTEPFIIVTCCQRLLWLCTGLHSSIDILLYQVFVPFYFT